MARPAATGGAGAAPPVGAALRWRRRTRALPALAPASLFYAAFFAVPMLSLFVLSFWRAGSWDIAALIFTASVVVPATKFLALGLLLWTVRRDSNWARRQRTALYRLVEIIGYWSMLDVVVVALTAALLKFKALGSAEPRMGIVFFCGVVVSTMIAALSFDPKLIWDKAANDGH